ncbi:MAG: hypothetical protein KDK70_17455 [Myxococcales bacterium]|nr:hypothetical protein [Myxococcales bacterium]
MQRETIASTLPRTDPEPSRPIVRHTRREGWGRALMLWERDDKRGYQFEDGEVRVFARPYFELLQPAKNPDPVLRHELREKAVANGALAHEPARSAGSEREVAVPRPTLDDQLVVFESLFPDGFHGDAWAQAHRDQPEDRRLKRHRQPAIAEAAERLERAVRDRPQPRLRVLLGVVRARQAVKEQDYERARVCYRGVLELDPHNSLAERELLMLSAVGR